MSTEEIKDAGTEAAGETTDQATGEGAGREKAFVDNLKKLALAAAGSVKVSPDDVKSFLTRLVEKGELAQQDARRIVGDVSDWVKNAATDPVHTAREAADKLFKTREQGSGEEASDTDGDQQLTDRIQASIERVLHAMRIASRRDLDELKGSIEALDAKLEELLKTRGLEPASA